jgi:hypothetical protein
MAAMLPAPSPARVHPLGERAAVERPGGGADAQVPHTNDVVASLGSDMPCSAAGPTYTTAVFRR